MTIHERITKLEDQLYAAIREQDGLRRLEIANELRTVKEDLERRIDLQVAKCFIASRNITNLN